MQTSAYTHTMTAPSMHAEGHHVNCAHLTMSARASQDGAVSLKCSACCCFALWGAACSMGTTGASAHILMLHPGNAAGVLSPQPTCPSTFLRPPSRSMEARTDTLLCLLCLALENGLAAHPDTRRGIVDARGRPLSSLAPLCKCVRLDRDCSMMDGGLHTALLTRSSCSLQHTQLGAS